MMRSEFDALPLQLLMDAEQTLDAAVDVEDGHLRFGQLGGDRVFQILDEPFRRAAPRLHVLPERLVRLRLEILERQLLQLVLDLAHPEPVRDRRVDVARLLRDLHAAIFGKMVECPHVVKAIGELHEDDADVVHHREQHLPEILGLPLFARRERNRADLGDAFDDVRDLGTEQLLDPLDRGQRVLDDVVQQPGGDGNGVELHVGEEVGHGQRMNQVGLAGVAHLAAVLEGREDVRAPQQLDVGVGAVGANLLEKIFEANHENRCLTAYRTVAETGHFGERLTRPPP